MTQTTLDELFGTAQIRNIERVSDAIGRHVVAFVQAHEQWHAQELRDYVAAQAEKLGQPTPAPSSAGRILRDLRQQGLIDYRVVNRRQSLYETIPIEKR